MNSDNNNQDQPELCMPEAWAVEFTEWLNVRGITEFDGIPLNLAPEAVDYPAALMILTPHAENGDAVAQYQLGRINTRGGLGVPQNEEEAARLYERAANQGYARAQGLLGEAYAHGHGVPQDNAKAVEWYQRAANQGDAEAQFRLGDVHVCGRGVQQDYRLAHKWFNLAAKQGHERARDARDELTGGMSAEDISVAHELAREFRSKPE